MKTVEEIAKELLRTQLSPKNMPDDEEFEFCFLEEKDNWIKAARHVRKMLIEAKIEELTKYSKETEESCVGHGHIEGNELKECNICVDRGISRGRNRAADDICKRISELEKELAWKPNPPPLRKEGSDGVD